MNNFWKDLLRTIGHSKGRFFAIAGICALGVGFFGGLQMTCGSMKATLDKYYNETNMMDIRVVSDLGISQDNVNSFKNVEGVTNVMPAYETDILTDFGNEQCAVRVHSLPDNLDTSNPEYINQVELSRGSWPQNNDECVLFEEAILDTPPNIGDEIDIKECSTGIDDTITVNKLKVVGFVHSSYYVGTVQMGTSVLGKGTVGQIAYVKNSFFKDSYPYSEVFITVNEARKYITGTDIYQKEIDKVMERLEEAAPGIAEIRSAEIKADAQKQIDEAIKTASDSEKLLKDNYSLFNSSKASILGSLDDAINTVNNMISVAKQINEQCNLNLDNLDNDNSLVINYSTAMQGLPLMISELNSAIGINNSLASLVDDAQVQEQIKLLNDATNAFNELCKTFYETLQIYPSVETYESFIGLYNEAYVQIYYALQSRSLICNGVISNCQDILENQLISGKASAISEFNKQELKLIDANAQLEDAWQKIRNSQSEINDLVANFYVMDRTKNLGSILYVNDSDRIGNIANVFPIMFFFVALLVVLTSMTRMIEEERTTIGTYKALGFSKYQISSKYFLYGVFASIAGSVIGLAILTQFFPYIIIYAYKTIYTLPIPLPMPFDLVIGIISLLIGVGVTVIATLMAATRSLRLSPANLMIPASPKAGKRIWLEYIRPIWRLLNFDWKISFRNMFLYKKRLFMTLIGIAGCTGLLLTGFGLHDSISDIMVMQFDEISADNLKIVFEDNANDSQRNEVVKSAMLTEEQFTNALICEENLLCMPEGHPNAPVTVVAPNDISQFESLRVIRNRQSQERLILDDKGVYVTEKLAQLMNVNVGDTITAYNQDLIGNAGSDSYDFYIAGIVENYIGHYIYMTPNIYKKYFNKECSYKSMIARSDEVGEAQQTLIDNIKTNKFVKTAYFTTNTRNVYEKSLQSVDMVVVVLIVSAGLLAFVVLYNLININLCERAREIATLKVLGSNRNETNLYIHRETFLLSLFGSLFGLGLGYVMEQFVSASAEVDIVMFGKMIYLPSYLYSFGITLLFTILVVLFMSKKLFDISMVESLKSVE